MSSTWEYSVSDFQVNTSTKATGMTPVIANWPSALGPAAEFWSILLHPPRWGGWRRSGQGGHTGQGPGERDGEDSSQGSSTG